MFTSLGLSPFSRRGRPHLPVHVEVGVSGGFGAVEAVLVLRRRRPRRVRRRRGHHHEEGLVVGFVLEEVQGHVGLRGNTKLSQILFGSLSQVRRWNVRPLPGRRSGSLCCSPSRVSGPSRSPTECSCNILNSSP